MKHKRLLLSAVLLLGLILTELQAQETILAAGGNVLGSGGLASYSVGQMVYTVNTAVTGSIAQGVQQPFEISVVTGFEEAKSINLMISVYPNPTTDYLQLKVESEKLKGLSYQLYDNSGRLLKNEEIISHQTSIRVSNLLPATYFIKVTQDNQALITLKIVKN